MNIQDLKNNRTQIIETITEMVGEEKLAEVMKQMLKGLNSCDTIEELIKEAIYFAFDFEVKAEKSKNAFILGRLAEMEN